ERELRRDLLHGRAAELYGRILVHEGITLKVNACRILIVEREVQADNLTLVVDRCRTEHGYADRTRSLVGLPGHLPVIRQIACHTIERRCRHVEVGRELERVD